MSQADDFDSRKAIKSKEPTASIAVRVGLAVFLVLGVLLVVLLSCFLRSGSRDGSAESTTLIVPPFATTTVSNSQPFPANQANVVLDGGANYVLNSSVDVTTIVIQNNARLTIADTGKPIRLRTKYLLIQNNGGLFVGTESAPYRSRLDIVLYGKAGDPETVPAFGGKIIGITPTGSIEIHGPWKLSWTYLSATVERGVSQPIVTLADNASTWSVGDQVVIASSDYDMNEAEVFSLVDCANCTFNQVKLNGTVKYRHLGTSVNGVDLRAEVGLLTRNIRIYGEMESACYSGTGVCDYFNYDTYGGSLHILKGAAAAHIEGVELFHMGQQVLGRYPIHFHRVFEVYGFYARQLSIHDCFSRCVTLHSAIGLQVEDVVGYNTIGHCFFLEDGNEQDNKLIHNLGLVIKPGSLLPPDRDANMCRALQTATSSHYTPNADKECMHVSTFWIAHPNNTFINNSAAGSEEVGYYFAFYREPTGPSAGTLLPYDGERSALEKFDGNRAHSNKRVGLLIDNGVKITDVSDDDPRNFLALVDQERYAPHVSRNLSLPRVPANITRYTAYKNTLGMFVRGGDVWTSNSQFSDNDVAVVMASSLSLPYDVGSHQQLVNSTLIGCSLNDTTWFSRGTACIGVQVYDGPVLISGNNFSRFETSAQRSAGAVGFYPNNTGQNSPTNTFGPNSIDSKSTMLQLGQGSLDGDLTQILYDRDGVLSGTAGSYILRADNLLLNRPETCSPLASNAAGVVCNGSYGQLFINVSSTNISLTVYDVSVTPVTSMTLTGVALDDPTQKTTTTQFQPVLEANRTYSLNWTGTGQQPPTGIKLSIYNFAQNSYVKLVLGGYSPTSTFNVTHRLWDQVANNDVSITTISPQFNRTAYDGLQSSSAYFWDQNYTTLYVTLVSSWSTDQYNYCPPDGCHFINIAS